MWSRERRTIIGSMSVNPPIEADPSALRQASVPHRRVADVDVPTFFWLMVVCVALGVAAGLGLFTLVGHLFSIAST